MQRIKIAEFMPSFLQVENISKSYGPKVLFDKISFNINEGDKIALVAPNGTGKTTLLQILAGKNKSDSGGSIKFLKDIRIAFLEQEYYFNCENTIGQQLYNGDFEQELRVNRILDELGLKPSQKMSDLSGGEVKRVAITEMLAKDAEFLIMDEPTNHLDLDGIEYLESCLKKSRCTLFMVTHDRYFLNRVCNTVMEMDRGSLYMYRGDYETFLEKRDERIANYNANTDKVRNILRRELEWMHATPCARSGKAKYRKQAFWDLKERAEDTYISKQVSMETLVPGSRMGTKVIDCKHLTFAYGDKVIVRDFTYNFQRYDRVGIVGSNGVGKTTFLNLLAGVGDVRGSVGLEGVMNGKDCGDGMIERGASLKIGYYRQQGISFNEDDTVLDIVPDTSLLEKFLFPRDMFNNKVARLSGGEKRRLYLLTVLMQEPNLLILDEPTNDLDIVTLNVLEEFLLDFKGSVIITTHDRHFLDRLVDHLLIFCGEGQIKDFIGGYSEYRSFMADLKDEKRREKQLLDKPLQTRTKTESVRRLSYKEKREMEELEVRMEALNKELQELEILLSGGGNTGCDGGSSATGSSGTSGNCGTTGSSGYEAIAAASTRYEALKNELDEAELRWLELSEIGTQR